jgi:hypothetical protein
MNSTSDSFIPHMNAKKNIEGICAEFPVHIIGPIVAMFAHESCREIVRYESARVGATEVAEFLMNAIQVKGANVKPMAKLQYLLVLPIFASNGVVSFPTHRFDRKYREDILAGKAPTPAIAPNSSQQSLLAKIEKKLSEQVRATPPSSSYESAHRRHSDQDVEGPPLTQVYGSTPSVTPLSQAPPFFSTQQAEVDPFVDQPSRWARPQSPKPDVPLSQNLHMLFDRRSQRELSPSWHGALSTSRPSRSSGTTFGFGQEPGPSRQSASRQPAPSSATSSLNTRPSGRQPRSSGLSKSVPAGFKQPMGPSVLSSSTPGSSRQSSGTSNRVHHPQTTPQSNALPSMSTTPRARKAHLDPATPAIHVPITPTWSLGATPWSANSPFCDSPVLPTNVLRYNPYYSPLIIHAKKGGVRSQASKTAPKE